MIKAIIVDDEPQGRKLLAALIRSESPDIEILAQADSVQSAVQAIREHGPNLVFLDIEMPTGSGFDVLETVEERNFQVIFVTAYEQYAVDAFRASALDYLLKPVEADDFRAAVDRVRKWAGLQQRNQRLDFLLSHVQHPQSAKKLLLPSADGFSVVSTDEILYLESDGNYSRLHMVDGKKRVVTKTLKDYESILAGAGFSRIHRSYLVNLEHVVRYKRGKGGEVTLTDGTELAVSRNNRDDFLDAIGSNSQG